MQFLASLPTFGQDLAAQALWTRLKDFLRDTDGICYYKHPIIAWTTSVPDLTLLARGFEPLAIRCIPCSLDEVSDISEKSWVIAGQERPSPLLELDDYVTGLQQKFDRERILRRRFKARSALALPLIVKRDFQKRFRGIIPTDVGTIWSNVNVENVLVRTEGELAEREWQLAKSVFQGIHVINKGVEDLPEATTTKGNAIRMLEKEIALLDEEQHKVAIQIAPGPQRVRGLAGTGKTVVLAMKAANTHLRFPERKILFTFHTQSLYNQAKALISRFYRAYSDADPAWENLHVRHSWGSSARPGVYYDVSKRAGVPPLVFRAAAVIDAEMPFRACCQRALKLEIEPTYDHILVDEAQDFPHEFFQLLYRLAKDDKAIYWAYDELQSLSMVDVPRPTEQFGTDEKGHALVSLDGEYPGGIEKDFVLHRSYRCPLEVLMLAHGIGLGIHSPKGCVQMLGNKASWTSIGYEIHEGNLRTGEETVICRPGENSPNRIRQIYGGTEQLIEVKVFDDRETELEWVAEAITMDIKREDVKPEHILVISLDAPKRNFTNLQAKLFAKKVRSTIPGLVDESWEFAEPGMVTLSTKFRAKGNEAPVVYIIGFDSLYGYTEEVEARNGAFTAISRAKAFLRISGSGKQMRAAKQEIDKILSDLPCFRFSFPDMETLRRLDASETTRRRRELRKARESVKALTEVEKEALTALDPELIDKLREVLREIQDEAE